MMTTLFLMKIGKEYFFKLVRFFFFISILDVVREITYWGEGDESDFTNHWMLAEPG